MLRFIAGLTVIMLALCGEEAWASGLSFDQQSAAAAGKANAFAGEANDPSAIFYNPAGITQLPGTQVMIGTAIVYLDSTFRSSTTGESTQLQDQFPFLPHLYITHRFKNWDERLSIGLGVYTPFGLQVDWPDNWQGRFNSTNVRLRVTIIHPTIAFQATPKLSVAAGIRITDAAAEFERRFGFPESTLRVHDLTAHPIGWNAALLYHVTDTTSVGLQFRSEIQAKANGEADITGPASAAFFNTKFHTSLKLPPELVIGISTRMIPRWTLNADVEWEGWRTVGSIPFGFETTPTSPFPQQLLNQPGSRLWKNSYIYRVGAEYAATDRLALRGGYYYSQSPIPDNTFDANIPEANLHAITAGLGYKWTNTTLDVAYLLGFYEKRTIDASSIDPSLTGGTGGPPAFGSYSTTAHVLTVSVTLKF
jgi:long-chain fatty acid transport protein